MIEEKIGKFAIVIEMEEFIWSHFTQEMFPEKVQQIKRNSSVLHLIQENRLEGEKEREDNLLIKDRQLS